MPIILDKKLEPGSKHVDMVWIDDDPDWVQNQIHKYFSNLIIDRYSEPVTFLEDLVQYPTNTKIILDMFYNHAGVLDLTGFQIAEQLFEKGYTKLFLLAGGEVTAEYYIPGYLTVISKRDEAQIANLINL